jgi:hypothetical protein
MRNLAQLVQRFVMGWTIGGSNPGKGEIFRIRPDRPWRPPSLLHNGYGVSFPKVKRPGRGVEHLLRSRAEVKERVNYTSTPLLGIYGL